ncbi:MAG: SMC family ATPase [Chloroflexi bacterium]|nr:SMC family ATPase [Chloroflexota bacterium]
MIPIQLSLSGFLSYREPVEIDFTSIDIACISGPNGAGKSSLLDAITWALFGQARRRDDAIINTHAEAAEVNFTFSYEGNVFRIQRIKPKNKTSILEFHIQNVEGEWKPLTERTMRATENRIEETLRLDYETFVNASFFLQGKADQFTQQRPADRKRILSNILGLEVWDTYRQAAAERRKGVDTEIGELEGRAQEINSELAEEGTRNTRLKELEATLKSLSQARAAQESSLEEMRRRSASLTEQEKLVATLAGQLQRTQLSHTESDQRLVKRKEEKQTYNEIVKRAKEIEALHKAWQNKRDELAKWEEIAARFHEHEKRRHAPLTEIQTELARLETEQETLSKEAAELESSQNEVDGLEGQIKSTQQEIEKLNAQLDQRAKLEGELNSAVQAQAEARAENPRLKTEMDELKERIDQLKETDGALCPLCGQPLNKDERKNLIIELETDGKQKGDSYRANQATLQQADKYVADLEKQIGGFQQVDDDLRTATRTADQAASQVEQIKEQAEQWKKVGAPRLKEIASAIKKESYAEQARETLAAVDAELKEIGYDAASHDKVRKSEAEKRSAEDEKRALENAQAALTPLQREIKDIETQLKAQAKEIKRQESAHDEAAASLAAAQAQAPDLAGAEAEMLSIQEEENKLLLEVGAAQQEVEVLKGLKTRLAELETQRNELAQQVSRYKALETAFGKDGVPAMLIEQAIPQIQTKANEILERLSGGDMNITFLTQQKYKDEKREDLRETLDIKISDSAGEREYEMFSGGEAFRINFAIRLALSEVLAQRAGARLQTLVIDEGFGSQDAIGRQRLVEAINLVKDDFEKILVITHIDSLKDAFANRIEVQKTPQGSVVSLV